MLAVIDVGPLVSATPESESTVERPIVLGAGTRDAEQQADRGATQASHAEEPSGRARRFPRPWRRAYPAPMEDAPDEILAIRVSAMPRDTNAHGTIFGGYILSLIDQAGAIAGHGLGAGTLVTVAMDKVEFKAPCRSATSSRAGRRSCASARVRHRVCPRRRAVAVALARGEREREVTQAEVVYVNIGDDGRPQPLRP